MNAVLGDLYDMDTRLREYNPELSLAYEGEGKWSVRHQGRQGRSYKVLTIGEGCGNRWPKDDANAPEITRPDMRLLYLIRAADFAAIGGHERAVREMDLREWEAKAARRRDFANHTEDVALDHHAFVKRELDGMPDMRVTFPAAKVEVS